MARRIVLPKAAVVDVLFSTYPAFVHLHRRRVEIFPMQIQGLLLEIHAAGLALDDRRFLMGFQMYVGAVFIFQNSLAFTALV